MIIKGCKKIVSGLAEGPSLVTSQPINFLVMIDAATGKVTDRAHELYDKSVKGTVLCFPHAIGSSVGAYSIYSLKAKGSAPSAVVCSKADITTASGCAIAGIPVVGLPDGVEIGVIPQGKMTHVDATGDHAIVKV